MQPKACWMMLCGVIAASAVTAVPAGAQTWAPPPGIPMPSFGVNEQARPRPNPWTTEVAGYYYVDNTHTSATDAVTYGNPSRPRRTIPPSVPAGSVVEVRGGPYTTGTNMSFGGNGTASSPIFYRGVNKPRIVTTSDNRNTALLGSYVIVEGFEWVNMQVVFLGHHQALRDSEIRGMPVSPGGSAVYIGVTSSGTPSDAVVLRNYIHNNGDANASVENDIHGVLVGAGAARVWIVDNEMHGNGGDSVQINSGQGTLARLVYIGRNRMHEEGENAVDIKTAEDVIVSQNTCWGFRPTQYAFSGSDGTAIVVNDDNASNRLNNRIWILFNMIYDSTVGVRTQSYATVLGNVFRDIQNAAVLSFGPHDVLLEHNTMNRVGRAFERSAGESTNRVYFLNGVVGARTGDDIRVSGSATPNSAVAHSLFGSPAIVGWGGHTYTGLSHFRTVHPCVACLEGSARFVNATSNDLRLASGSPAIGTASPTSTYAAFQQLYGVSISYDAAGRTRPGADGRWDMGAYESDGGGAGTAPPPPPSPTEPPVAPTNLRIIN